MQWIMQTRTFSALMNCMPFVYTLKLFQLLLYSMRLHFSWNHKKNNQTPNNAEGTDIWRYTVKTLNAFKMHTKSTISLNRCSRTVFVFHVFFLFILNGTHFFSRSNLIAKCEIVNVYVTYSEIHCWLDSITDLHAAHTTRKIVFFLFQRKNNFE